MSTHTHDPRFPLTLKNGSSTFLIAVSGILLANLAPLVIAVLTDNGFDLTTAGNTLTWAFLGSAIIGLGIAPLMAGKLRKPLTALSLLVATVAFGIAATGPDQAMLATLLIIGGSATGGAIAGSSAAIAALRNPNRITGVSGVTNRIVVMLVFAVVPLIGISSGSIFGALALFTGIGLLLIMWLPNAPENAAPAEVTTSLAIAAPQRTTLWGIIVLIVFPIWAIAEEAVYNMLAPIGAELGLDDAGLSTTLSWASGAGIAAMLLVIFAGARIGRALPLAITMALGAALKIAYGFATTAAALQMLIVLENAFYVVAFSLFIATAAGLDARGKWSGPLIATYVIGSSFGPAIGAAIYESMGAQFLTVVMGIVSILCIIPMLPAARVSIAAEKAIARSGGQPN